MFIRFALIAAAVAALARPAAAQDVGHERPVDLNMGAGFTIPYSGAKDGFGPAGNLQIGVTGNITQEFAIQANYGYNHFASTDISPTAATTGTFVSSISLTAKHTMHDGDVSLVAEEEPRRFTIRTGGGGRLSQHHQRDDVERRKRHGVRAVAAGLLYGPSAG
jgi:hypothetical protein